MKPMEQGTESSKPQRSIDQQPLSSDEPCRPLATGTRIVDSMGCLLRTETCHTLFSNRALRAVVLTDFFVLLSELSAVVILPWWITSRGGAHAITVFSATVAIAAFIAMPAMSPFGDRICKGRQITWGLGCLCLVAAVLAGLSLADTFSLPVLIPLALVQVLAATFVAPARDAILTEVVSPEQLPAAIRLRKSTQALSGILGPVLAGAVIGAGGVTAALAFYGGLLFIAMLAASRLPLRAIGKPQTNGLAVWWRDLRTGLTAKWHMPMERGWTIVNFAVWVFQGPAVGLLIPLKVQSLGLQGNWLGVCLGALSLGVLLGSSFGSGMFVERFGRYHVRVGLGFMEGIALAIVGFSASPCAMLVGLAAAGFCNASMGLVGATHRALAIPQTYRVRMFAAASMSTQIASALGPSLVGWALARHSVAGVYTAWGLLMSTCVLGFLAVPRLKEFLALDHDEITDWYRRQYPSIFK